MCRWTKLSYKWEFLSNIEAEIAPKKCVVWESVVVMTLSQEYVVATTVSLFQRQILETLSLDMTNVRFSRKCLCNDTFSNDTFFRRDLWIWPVNATAAIICISYIVLSKAFLSVSDFGSGLRTSVDHRGNTRRPHFGLQSWRTSDSPFCCIPPKTNLSGFQDHTFQALEHVPVEDDVSIVKKY